ncbi:protein kinase [Trichocoleus sp. FACHB-591]|uniref:protein kinase domain-containing protein n=1 Tax=Trichocoleus sp. FACHB-591 TaxID=2692872 RepID=UPI0016886F39|nr:protein kinase [Trichocoleus sp. FACHB-591]
MVTLTLLDPQALIPPQRWCFENEPIIRIGRSPDNHIVLNSTLVSRYHVELRQTDATDLESPWEMVNQGRNGTFLNGILVSQGLLLDGALLQLAQGGPTLKFQVQTTIVQSYQLPVAGCPHLGNPPDNLFCLHCGQPLRVERQIRQYQILRALGQGGMGTTYLAWDAAHASTAQTAPQQLGRSPLRVLKEMNADMATVAKAQELFEREARILQTLQHPGIPQFFDYFVEDGKKYLVMEMIQGQDLEKRIYQQGPVGLKLALKWMVQACQVLDYMHRQHPPVIHRDIKPANLMVRHRNQQIVVLDFGAVKEFGTPLGTRIGAEGYSAPEQEQGQPVTQSDLYAIAPTLVFLVTGETPYKFYRKRGAEYRFRPEGIPTITPRLQAVLERVTHPQVGERYQTAQELAQALASCL